MEKVIHYVWVGRNPKPQKILDCIKTWEKYMPDYKIIEWNEDNFDINQCKFAKQAYEVKKWAFVSDYMRFKILFEHGGIYMDTDVELLKPIPQEILAKQAFTGFEYSKQISPGLIYGCHKGDWVSKEMIKKYESIEFDPKNLITINVIITNILAKYGAKNNNEYQEINGLAIYPDEYFCGYNQDIKEISTTEKTIAIHHYYGTWTKPTLKKKLQKIVKKIVGIENYKKILMLKRKIVNENNK